MAELKRFLHHRRSHHRPGKDTHSKKGPWESKGKIIVQQFAVTRISNLHKLKPKRDSDCEHNTTQEKNKNTKNKKDNEHNKRNEIVAPETVTNWTKQPKNESQATRGYTREGFPATAVCDPKAKSACCPFFAPFYFCYSNAPRQDTDNKAKKAQMK